LPPEAAMFYLDELVAEEKGEFSHALFIFIFADVVLQL
jgi:hypothetical protein